MGFESSRVSRRRLAALATSNESVSQALSPSSFPDLFSPDSLEEEHFEALLPDPAAAGTVSALARQLDMLARDIVATPGAGGALLTAYAAQARALTMVVEAARRAGSSPLPASVLSAAQEALSTPSALAGLVPA